MSIFQNPFFSKAGQIERLKNAENTLLAAVGIKKGGVQSNTGNKVADAVLSSAASHPFITAGAAAVAINPAGAVAAGKAAAQGAASAFGKASIGQKAAVVVGTPIAAGVLINSPKAREGLSNAPGGLVNFGSNVGKLVEDPSLDNVSKTIKDNPVIAGVVGAGAAIGAGVGIGGIASTVSTVLNTRAVKENTKAMAPGGDTPLTNQAANVLSPQSVAGGSSLVAPVADSSARTPILGGARTATTRRKRRIKQKPQSISQNVRVNIVDDRDTNDRKVYKQVRQRG